MDSAWNRRATQGHLVGGWGPAPTVHTEVYGDAKRGLMLRLKKIDHVAVCVSDIDAAARTYKEVFGLEASCREVVSSQKTEVLLLPIGEGNIELISPRGN